MVAQTAVVSVVNGVKANGKQNKSKNQLRREKAKQKKVQQQTQEANGDSKVKSEPESEPERNVEYVSEQLDVKGPALEAFSDVFARFQLPPDALTDYKTETTKGEIIYSDDEIASEADSDASDTKKPLSKKKQRKMARLTVAELKQLVKKPEVVEWTDVTAADPRLLLH
jgi:splicing factor 3B subunit 2